jgi:alkanesulfonate monooxygenase SsuD/methylene tetrahydromethanopterin reductase-like flavin-dependent oxidoreductase (luciferase family)
VDARVHHHPARDLRSAKEKPLQFEGERYQIPYRGPGSTGLGKPLRSILHGRKDLPIYTGSMAPKGQALSAELADGMIMTCLHPERFDVVEANLRAGFEKAGGHKSLANFDVMPTVAVIVGDDIDACRMPIKMSLALYVGGMGARNKNFYNDYIRRIGFEAEAVEIQNLYLDGKKSEAIAKVPDKLVDTLHLVGPADRIRERFQVWKQAAKEGKVGTLLVGTVQPEAVRLIAELAQS